MRTPPVYFSKDSEFGGLWAAFCELGLRIANDQSYDDLKNQPGGARGCNSMSCACAYEGTKLMRPATPEQTKSFWNDMSEAAGEQLAAIQGGW